MKTVLFIFILAAQLIQVQARPTSNSGVDLNALKVLEKEINRLSINADGLCHRQLSGSWLKSEGNNKKMGIGRRETLKGSS
jgi:hypothetical protein